MRKLMNVLSLAILVAGSVSAQHVVSAHSGVINKAEGRVLLDGKLVEPKFAEFPEIKLEQTLATEDGRAEVLLTPGSFFRLDENTSFQMIGNKLANTRVKILTGSTLLEVAELSPENALTLLFGATEVSIVKPGVYRVDAAQSRLRVYEGEARVTSSGQTLTAKRGKEVTLGALLVAGNFDTKSTDSFHRWSARRSEYIAKANVSSANTSRSNCYTSSGSNCGSSWSYNPWFGLYTWIPGGRATYCNFFGYCFYSPYSVYNLYYPPQPSIGSGFGGSGPSFANPSSPQFDSSVGYNTSARSGVSASAPSTSAVSSGASSAAAGSSRGGGAATSSAGGTRGH